MSTQTNVNNDGVAARKAIRLVWDEARRYGGTIVELKLSSQSVSYMFRSIDGRTGEGAVNARYAVAIQEVLEASCSESGGTLQVSGEDLAVLKVSRDQFRITLLGKPISSIEGATAGITDRARESTKSNVVPFVASSAIAKSEQDNDSKKDNITVLIVEDNKTFSKVLVRFLERQGFVVQICEDGKEAIEKLQTGFVPDLVISDLHMPHINGDEFASLMRGIDALVNVPLILLTSDRATEVEIRALLAGADLFLAKSEDPRLIAAYARRLLARAGAKPGLRNETANQKGVTVA